MHLSHLKGLKRKRKGLAAVPSELHCANIQSRTFLQLAVSLKCTHGTRKGALQAWGCGNISKGNEVRKRMSGRGCCRAPHYNEKYYPESPIKKGLFLKLFISSETVFFCLRFCLVSLWRVFLLASWKCLYVSLLEKN